MAFAPDRWLRRAGDLRRRGTVRAAGPAAWIWRRCYPGLESVAVTGSYGKSTCRRMLVAMLARVGPALDGARGTDGSNFLARSVLDLRPRHRFAVFELSGDAPGTVAARAALAAPRIGVVLGVGGAHLHNFGSLDAVAAEKCLLVGALPRDGVAVLNADDPRTAAMADSAGGRRVATFGRSPGATVRASNVEARWPERLSFGLSAPRGDVNVSTQLIGEHWLPAVLGAATAALEAGVSLDDIAAGAAAVEPAVARLQPVPLPNGATLIRDEFNGTEESWAPALAVLAQARIPGRRILVAGETSQSALSRRNRLRALGERAAAAADLIVLVGDQPKYAIQGATRAGFDPARMEPMDLPSGATLLRDEFDGTRDTWDPALRVLREARIDGRRWLIAGDFSDSKKRARRRASEVGRLAAESADGAIFVGERAEHAVQAAIEAGMPAGAAESCYSCEDAAELVRQRLRRGDLALLKGRHTEHLSRIALAQIATVDCRRTDCSRLLLCDVCPDLRAAGKVDPSSGVESD